jgi:GH18 family chitinase
MLGVVRMRTLSLLAIVIGVCLFACSLDKPGNGGNGSPDMAMPGVGGNGMPDMAMMPPIGPSGNDLATSSSHDLAQGGGGHAGDMAKQAQGARVVAYLPNYNGSYADWAKSIDFSKMTHLNLAFASANNGNGWDMGAADNEVKALVDAAHAHGVKVLASLGGGGGDQSVIAQFKDPNNVPPLVDNLDQFVAAHAFDGVDIDIEDPNNLGDNYSNFVGAVVAKLHPEGKLVTAAVAQYLQDSMNDATLHSFDFINVMIYVSDFNQNTSEMDYYANTKNVPKKQIVLGAGFFGTDPGGMEYAYKDILAADGSAWSRDSAQVNGQTVNYTGMMSIQKLATYSKGFGGIMFWELTEDVTDDHSLYKVIQSTM